MGKRQRRRTVSFRPNVFHALADIAKARKMPVARLLDHLACAELERNGLDIAPFEGRAAAKPRVRKPSKPKVRSAHHFPGLKGVRAPRLIDADTIDHGAYLEL